MNFKYFKFTIPVILSLIILTGCTTNGKFNKKGGFKHDTPLIKDEDIRVTGKETVDKTIEMGPQPIEGDVIKLGKRKQISSQKKRNYLLIPESYKSLKQSVSFKFQNLDYREAMDLMAQVGDINILVGEEVAGSINAQLVDVPWDKAFNAILDLKNFAADFDVSSNLIRVHSPANLTAQESTKSARASAVKKKVELEDSVEPIISEIFRLYYITPAEAKSTLTELFASIDDNFSPIKITEEKTTRSIIVRGKETDLDIVDKIIKEIDVRTKQVLIEAFIVEANSDFERALGTRLGGYYKRQDSIVGGVQGASTGDGPINAGTAVLGGAVDSITDFGAAGATSVIGILKKTG